VKPFPGFPPARFASFYSPNNFRKKANQGDAYNGTCRRLRRIAPMSKAREYRDRAERCQRFAKEDVSKSVREHWLELARFWERFALTEELSERPYRGSTKADKGEGSI
jgi:hypothetical protein